MARVLVDRSIPGSVRGETLMHYAHRLACTVAVLLLAQLVAGCGDDKDKTAPPAPVVEPTSSPTSLAKVMLYGSGEPNATIDIAEEMGAFPRVLLEVNVAGEATKFGFTPDRLRAQMETLLGLRRLQIEGLMTIAPYALEPELSRPHFAALRELRDRLQTEFRVPLPRLSMGMSGDFEVAIEEGATLVRVGTAIFGKRSGKGWHPASGSGTNDD